VRDAHERGWKKRERVVDTFETLFLFLLDGSSSLRRKIISYFVLIQRPPPSFLLFSFLAPHSLEKGQSGQQTNKQIMKTLGEKSGREKKRKVKNTQTMSDHRRRCEKK
jgi:hypothetical protein